jgi:hypothetical protein
MSEHTLGIDLGGTKLLLCGEGVYQRIETGSAFTPNDLSHHLRKFVASHRLSPTRIGIAVPGLVDADGAVLASDVLPLFSGWQPKCDLAAMKVKWSVLNDVKAALIEEMHDAPPGLTGGVVMVGTAIGAGLWVDGKALLGASGWAGELGYLPIMIGERIDRLDNLAGGHAIAAHCSVLPGLLAEQANSGDLATLQAIASGGRALGLGLAALINLLNPSRLALGGGTVELPGYWAQALRSAEEHSIPELWRDCRISKVREGAFVVAKGALRSARQAE